MCLEVTLPVNIGAYLYINFGQLLRWRKVGVEGLNAASRARGVILPFHLQDIKARKTSRILSQFGSRRDRRPFEPRHGCRYCR